MALDKKAGIKETVKSLNDGSQSKAENQFGEASSIDKVNLNNKIISMRSTIKKSKIRILTKLIRHIKDLNRKINEKSANVQKKKRKHANLVEEMKTIKALKADTVSRFVLGNTCTFEELNNKGFQSTEARALARFADEPLLKDVVKKFRAEHSDWKSLAAFVQTQSSGRHIKKKNKNKNKKTEKHETKTNIKAKQIMVSNFVHGKVDNMNSTINDMTSDATNAKPLLNVKSSDSNKNQKLINKDLHHDSSDAKVDANQKKSDSAEKNSNKKIQDSKKLQNSPNNESKNLNTKLAVKKEPTQHSTQNAAMVVKKINLMNFDDGDDILIDKTKDTMTANLFGVENNRENQSESLFFTSQDSSVMETEENETENYDQKKDDDDDDFIVSGNHSMFLSLSGKETESFKGGRGKRGRMDFNSPHSDFKRTNSQGYRNSGYRNNIGRGKFSNRGGREKTYPPTKTFKESKYTPSNNMAKQKLSDKSNLNEEKLHPSWEASRKRKEQAASISAFQGKKTTFDDDD